MINTKKREDAYHTIFYLLTHVALWRKNNGKLKPAYKYVNWLKPTKLIPINEKIIYRPDKCTICKKPRKKILEGFTISGDIPHFKKSVSIFDKAKRLGIKVSNSASKEIKEALDRCVYNNQNLKVQVSLKDIKLGHEVLYRHIVREYRIEHIKELRTLVRRNIRRYQRDKLKYIEKCKESNGFG